jgi:hypothetical protein
MRTGYTANLLFSKQHDPITTLQWASSGLVVETRYEGIGVLNPLTGERIHDVVFHEDCEAAQPAVRRTGSGRRRAGSRI